MFKSARLKLTVWYLLIIILITLTFTSAIYGMINQEYTRIEQVQQARQLRRPEISEPFYPEVVEEARGRLKIILGLVDLAVIILAGGASYFLAGRTLDPIKQMMEEQNRFVGDASHELRTPLTSLKTSIEVYLRGKSNAKEADELLKSNLEEVNCLQSLSDNLIKLTQYQKNGQLLTFEKVSLLEATKEAEKKVANLAKAQKVTIKNAAQDKIIEGDKQSLTELFTILLDNAVKYSRKNTQVIIVSKALDGHVQIRVKDEGAGIAKEDLNHLFDRFFRTSKSRTRGGTAGYGLGLSIAKQVVERHRGTISVDSQVNRGTTFIVNLPVSQSFKQFFRKGQ